MERYGAGKMGCRWGDGKPIATGQAGVGSLIKLNNGELISGGSDGTLRRWKDVVPVGDGRAIDTGHRTVTSLIQLDNGELMSGGLDGTLRRFSLKTVARTACQRIDLESLETTGYQAPVSSTARKTCQKVGIGN
jgi:WD40 repeat protein